MICLLFPSDVEGFRSDSLTHIEDEVVAGLVVGGAPTGGVITVDGVGGRVAIFFAICIDATVTVAGFGAHGAVRHFAVTIKFPTEINGLPLRGVNRCSEGLGDAKSRQQSDA